MDNHSTAAGLERLAFEERARGVKKQQVMELLATGGLEALWSASDLQGLPTCEALLEQSWTLRYEDPGQMMQLALAAVMVADRLSDAALAPQKILELRCRAWTELGNACRVNDELDYAEEAIGQATELFVQCSQSDLLGARFFDVVASLFAARRSFELALAALDAVADIYRRCGDEHLLGRALISRGIYTGYRGDAEEAVRFIKQGLASVDEQRDPRLAFSALQAQAWFHVDCQQFREARMVLWELRKRRQDNGGQMNELKLRWLEGHILAGRGKLEHAGEALAEVKQGFEEAELPYKAALAGLELGVVRLRQGRAAEAEEVVLECTEVFLSLRIEREALATVLVARKAAEMRRLTLDILTLLIERLRRGERE